MYPVPVYQVLDKSVYSKRKESASNGTKFIPFRIDPLSEGEETTMTVLSLASFSCIIPFTIHQTKKCYVIALTLFLGWLGILSIGVFP